MPSIGFIAYASGLEMVGETIEAALEIYAARQGRDKIASWRENDVSGRFIVDPILENISASQCLIADVSLLNFNVTYEVGYAIGAGKRVILVKIRRSPVMRRSLNGSVFSIHLVTPPMKMPKSFIGILQA